MQHEQGGWNTMGCASRSERWRAAHRCWLLTALLASGAGALPCTGCSDSPGGASDAAVADAAVGDPSVLVGQFQISLVAPQPATANAEATAGHTAVVGKVYDGPTPSLVVWEESAQAGACRLLTPRVPFCATACGVAAACVADDRCQSYPSARSVGVVAVAGVRTSSGASAFTMEPVANAYQPAADLTLPYPAFDEGAPLRLQTSGGAFAPFALESVGVSPLVLTDHALVLRQGQPLALSWNPPGPQGGAGVHVTLDISHHGGTKGKLECETADTGSLELPSTLVTELLSLGVAGFPTIVVRREARGTATIAAGRVDLLVFSEVEQAVEVPGLTSCTDNEQCPPGESCQPDLSCR